MKRIFIFGLVFITAVFIAYFLTKPNGNQSLPILNPIDVKTEMVDPELLRLGFGHKVSNFSFLNQDGQKITQKEVQGKVYVVEYFFTTCGSICPIMNQQMQRVQKRFYNNENLKILSFTVHPEVDTVAQMKRYALSHNAKSGQWHFLTGDKNELYRLARKSFFVLRKAEVENQGDNGSDFIHTNNFVLIDQQMRIRGYYDGTNPKEVGVLLNDINLLLNESVH